MKKIIIAIMVLINLTGLSSFACDVLQIQSVDVLNQTTRIGNGFAYQDQVVVTNDHTLLPNVASVTMTQGIQKILGRVIYRDFHTDLAVIQVQGAPLSACSLGEAKGARVAVRGFDGSDSKISITFANIKNDQSTKLVVPGIERSLEIVAEGQAELRSSQSGSIVEQNNQVVGLVTQKTAEGSALAIPAIDIQKLVTLVLKNQGPKRQYEVDQRTQKIKFFGLIAQNSLINPHEGHSPNPHEGHSSSDLPVTLALTNDPNAPVPIALDDYNLGAVLATVEDAQALLAKQPILGQALFDAGVKRVFISSIDGIKVRNLLELLRMLEKCNSCIVDNFWIEVKNPKEVSEPTLRLMGWISVMVVELEKDNSKEQITALVSQLSELQGQLTRYLTQAQMGRKDLSSIHQIKKLWVEIQRQMLPLYQSETVHSAIAEIELILEQVF